MDAPTHSPTGTGHMSGRVLSKPAGVIAACTVGNAVGVTPMVYTVFSLFLIPISTEFGWPRSAVSIVLLFIAIAGALSYPVIGRLIDRHGGRRIILAGNLLFAASVAAVALTPANRWLFYSVFFVLGVTAAIPSPAMFTKVIAGWFDRSRGFALGFVGGVGNGTGAAISPVFAAYLLGEFGWRGAHLGIAAAIVIVGFPVLFWLLRDPPDARITAANQTEGLSLSEARETLEFWLILTAIALGAGCMTAVFAHVIPMLVDRNIPLNDAVAVLVTFSMVTAGWQVGMGFVLDKFSRPWIAAPFYLLAIIGLWILETGVSFPLLILAGVLMGLGLGTEYGILPYFLSRYFGVRHYGAISGFAYGLIILIQGVTPFLMDVNFDLRGDYRLAVVVISVAMLIGTFILTRLPSFEQTPRAIFATRAS